jgi:putative RNA 2'-phosphotransferase
MRDFKSLSKFLSLILRHRAEDFGLTLDAEGFTSFDAVKQVLKSRFRGRFSEEDLARIIEVGPDDKRRFEVRGGRIRALYGHSQVSAVEYEPAEPPEVLFHGTSPGALPSIRREGLRGMGRQYVHLSTDEPRALEVARRRTGEPILLCIRAKEAFRAGVVFHCPDGRHFLVRALPPEFIEE